MCSRDHSFRMAVTMVPRSWHSVRTIRSFEPVCSQMDLVRHTKYPLHSRKQFGMAMSHMKVEFKISAESLNQRMSKDSNRGPFFGFQTEAPFWGPRIQTSLAAEIKNGARKSSHETHPTASVLQAFTHLNFANEDNQQRPRGTSPLLMNNPQQLLQTRALANAAA